MTVLDEKEWIYGWGLGPGWRFVTTRRREETAQRLKAAAAGFRARAPKLDERDALARGVESLARDSAPPRLLDCPALDYWLYMWDKEFSAEPPPESWETQFRLAQPLAALAAARSGRSGRFPTVVDSDGHVHFYGTTSYVELPRGMAARRAWLEASPRGLRLAVDGKKGEWLGLERLEGAQEADAPAGLGRLRRPAGPAHDVGAGWCGPLLVHGVTMHGLHQPKAAEARRFSASLAEALSHLAERDPGLSAELRDMTQVLVPLVNPKNFGSVSSSYANLRGMIALSHSDDTLLQAETLIHEFCHMKMNLLLAVEALIEPGQSGQVFYSPWRKDARRLRGLILGAHAFLNVARYMLTSLSREKYPLQRRVSVSTNAVRRLFEVRDALQTVCGHATLTEFGRRFVLGMFQEVTLLFHAAQWLPPALVDEVRASVAKHRAAHALPELGFHKAEGFSAKVRPFDFGKRRGP